MYIAICSDSCHILQQVVCHLQPLHRAVVIAKLSPQGELVWHKAIYGPTSSYAFDLRPLGDTAFMVMTAFWMSHNFNGFLYYLDTLLTSADAGYLQSSDSTSSYSTNAFITFDLEGNVIEQHFLELGYVDNTGHTIIVRDSDPGQALYAMYSTSLSSLPFGVDTNGNIYVIRYANDMICVYCDTCPDSQGSVRLLTIADGTLEALRIMVDGSHPILYYPPIPAARCNVQILKFSPHFDSLISAVYVFDSMNYSSSTYVEVKDFNNDARGNLYINIMCHNVLPPLMIYNTDSLCVDMSTWMPTLMIKYNSNLQAIGIAQLSHIGDSSNLVEQHLIYSHIDNSTNSVFLLGVVSWESNLSDVGITYGNDTLDLSRRDAYWIRLDMDNLRLLSLGKARPGVDGYVYEPKITTYKNRVFAQTKFSASINFNGVTHTIPNTTQDDNVFLIWDNDGNELLYYNYNSFSRRMLYEKPNVIDSIVYLSGSLYANATFDTITTQTYGSSYAYIAKYVDPAFMIPYG